MSWHVLDIVTIEATLINTQIKSKISNVTIFYTPCMRCNTQPCTKTAHLTSHSAALLSLSPYFTLFSRHYLCLQNKSDPILTRSGPRMALLLLLHQLCSVRSLWYWSITETAASPWASQYVLWCQLDVWMMEPLWHLMAAEGLPANSFHMPEDI